MKRGRVLVILGPTASGKTSLALEISTHLDCEIVSADSRQVHAHMEIGTAQPASDELRRVPHHFVGEMSPGAAFNAGVFGTRGREVIADICLRRKVPLVVGGSGLYVRSLIDGLFDGPGAVASVRKELDERLKRSGAEALLEDLRRVDPAAARTLTAATPRRIMRALEVHRLSGTPISELQRVRVDIPFTFVQVGLRWPRQVLYERINRRVIAMVNAGLVEETRRLLDLGYAPGLRSMQTLGYREALDFLEGSVSHSGMIGRIQMNTRRFAKRQLTWFRRDPRIRWFDIADDDEIPGIAARVVALFGGADEPPF
ncbi:MAG TPA: tRNA (adenosine(37)-N6)-dimethylallyltransferase MiaA [Bacteroidota bacterium]|nr:tRNA (adenosine(37)-N6)-dimethylallyltransferase MiaA [Bacteroidota bacterium]